MKKEIMGSGLACLGLAAPAWAAEPAVTIDGRIDEAEWASAQRITDFRKVQPLSGEPGSQQTEAWVLSTPDGLAVAFRNLQPAGVPRTRQQVRRDFEEQVDRVNLMVDFDGDGRTAFNFTVASTGGIADAIITNESSFSDDWDGNWRYAAGEDADSWSVEMLIPWHIAPMRKADGGTRTIKLYLDRVIGSTGERMGWPLASFERPRFVSDFAPMQLQEYSQSLLAITPYVSGLHDIARDGENDFNGGVDVFWKPNGQFQLSATVNPDFGQVESDDLVVNFSATETFVSDKRPFFTENQGIFEYTTPSDFSQLLYTRRIGAPADDGSGASDIDAAIKLNGSFGATKYGVFAAEEDGDAGRSFNAVRLVRDFEKQNIGAMWVRTDRPFLDRQADVFGIDHNWRPNARWNVRTRVFGSQIEQAGEKSEDIGATVWADYEMDRGWRQQFMAMHFGDELQINDAGYLSRNNMNYGHYEVRKRFPDQPEGSRYASKDWRWRISTTHNDHGQKLNDQFRMSRQSQLRDGSSEYAQVQFNSAGISDNLLRGNGIVRLPSNFSATYEYERPRKGRWGYITGVEAFSGGLEGNDKPGYAYWYEPTYFVSDAFSLNAGLTVIRRPDWLIWQGAAQGNLVGAFDGRETRLTAGLDWSIDGRQELRVKLQSIGVGARMHHAWRFDPNGYAIAAGDTVEDFSVRTLGFQIRYRYELAPLSYLYVVYGRGGYQQEAFTDETGQLLQDAFELRNDEQVLVKLSYRFEI